MDSLTRKVLARYRSDFDERPPEQDQSWMDYLKSRNEQSPMTDTAKEIVEHGKPGGSGQSAYNPYDYEDPSEKPKDPGGPPFESEVPQEIDVGYFDRPKLFKDHGELEEWLQNQGQDMTDVEEDQEPAISITRKYAMVQNVLARYMMDSMPIVVSEDEFDSMFLTTKVAASLDDVIDKDYHSKNDLKLQRSKRVSAVWSNKNNPAHRERGFFTFTVVSPGSKTGPHTVFLQFLRGEEEKQYPSYAEYPVQMACTCPSFLYHGAQSYAVRGGYMYMPALRQHVVDPKPETTYVIHPSDAYPRGRRYPGRGLNFRVCKHLVKVYELLKNMRIESVYKKYPLTAPPSKIMNAEEWKRLMKFDFTEANIKQSLKASRPKIPAYFNSENLTKSVIDWFNSVWIPRNDDQKIKALQDLSDSPERIFFILMKEAYLKSYRDEKVSDRLINEGYDLMVKVVQPDNALPPEQAEMPEVPEEEKAIGKGTGITPPGGDKPADEFIKEPSQVEPATEETPSALAPTTLRKVLTPEERRKQREDKRKEEQERLRQRGLSERARGALKRFQEETVEPRKEKLRQVGKRPFYEE